MSTVGMDDSGGLQADLRSKVVSCLVTVLPSSNELSN